MLTMDTNEIRFWCGNFGGEYTDRNTLDDDAWDKKYIENWGSTRLEMNEACIGLLSKDARTFEVGCNTGMQLSGLQRKGFTNLYGIEIQRS